MGTKYGRERQSGNRRGVYRRLGSGEPRIGSRALILRFFFLYGLVGAMVVLGLMSQNLMQSLPNVEVLGTVTSKSVGDGTEEDGAAIEFQVKTAEGGNASYSLAIPRDQWRALEVGSAIYATFRSNREGGLVRPVSLRPVNGPAMGVDEEAVMFESIPLPNDGSLPTEEAVP